MSALKQTQKQLKKIFDYIEFPDNLSVEDEKSHIKPNEHFELLGLKLDIGVSAVAVKQLEEGKTIPWAVRMKPECIKFGNIVDPHVLGVYHVLTNSIREHITTEGELVNKLVEFEVTDSLSSCLSIHFSIYEYDTLNSSLDIKCKLTLKVSVESKSENLPSKGLFLINSMPITDEIPVDVEDKNNTINDWKDMILSNTDTLNLPVISANYDEEAFDNFFNKDYPNHWLVGRKKKILEEPLYFAFDQEENRFTIVPHNRLTEQYRVAVSLFEEETPEFTDGIDSILEIRYVFELLKDFLSREENASRILKVKFELSDAIYLDYKLYITVECNHEDYEWMDALTEKMLEIGQLHPCYRKYVVTVM